MERLRYIRETAGYSQQDLADKSGVSQHTISEIELGRRKPQGRTLRKLAGALGVDVADLYAELVLGKGRAPQAGQPPRRLTIELAQTDAERERGQRLKAAFAELGIPVTDAEIRSLNMAITGRLKSRETGKPYTVIGETGVDLNKVALLAACVLDTDLLRTEEGQAARQIVREVVTA